MADPTVFNLTDYALDPNNASPAFDAALADIATKFPPSPSLDSPAVLVLPGGTLKVTRPVWLDRDNFKLKGAGKFNTTIQGNSGFCGPIVVNGVRRSPHGVSVDSSYYPDCYGKFDASTVTAAGQMCGVRTKGNAHPAFMGTPFDKPNNDFSSLTALTLEICFENPAGPVTSGMTLCGFGTLNTPCPFRVQTGPSGQVIVMFTTADQVLQYGPMQHPYYEFTFTLPNPTGVKRAGFTIDLGARTVTTWADGQFVTNSGASEITPYVGTTYVGLRPGSINFAGNDVRPFQIGVGGVMCSSTNSEFTNYDLIVYGLKMASAAVYNAGAVGTALVRKDAQTITDGRTYRYDGTWSDGVQAYLNCTPTDLTTTGNPRLVAWQGQGYSGYGLLISDGVQGGGNYLVLNNEIEDLGCKSNGTYGDALVWSGLLDSTVRRCYLVGGSHGIGAYRFDVVWGNAVEDCRVAGNFAGILLSDQTGVTVNKVRFEWPGRVGFLTTGSTVYGQQWWLGLNRNPADHFIKIVENYNTNDIEISGVYCDEEINPPLGMGAVYCENSLEYESHLTIKNFQWGYTKTFLTLRAFGSHGGRVHAEDLNLWGGVKNMVVDCDNGAWVGEVDRISFINGATRFVGGNVADNVRNIRCYHDMANLPAQTDANTYTADADIIRVLHPVVGGPIQYNCVTTGTLGTSAWSAAGGILASGISRSRLLGGA